MSEENIRRDYYVYLLLDPSKNLQPFYVGKGVKSRVIGHFCPSKVNSSSHKNNIIRKYRELGFSDCYKILQTGLTETQAFLLEEAYIKLFGRKKDGGCLVNHSKGGEGVSGFNTHRSEEAKEIWKKNISLALKGRKISDEQKLAVSKTHKNKPKTEESNEKRAKSLSKFISNNPSYHEILKNNLSNGRDGNIWYEVIFPTGEVWVLKNLRAFCKQHNLPLECFRPQLEGRKLAYKGWKCRRYDPRDRVNYENTN